MTVTTGGDTDGSGSARPRGLLGIAGRRYEPRPPSPARAAVGLCVPVLGVAAGIAAIAVLLPREETTALLRFAVSYVLPFGIFWAGPVNVALGLAPLHMVLVVGYFDVFIALFWIWNLDHLMRFARVRRAVDRTVVRAEGMFRRHPWLGGSTVPGIMLWVGLPIPGTGLFSGIIIGKLIGLRPAWIFFAVMVGTVARVAALAYGSEGVLWLFGR